MDPQAHDRAPDHGDAAAFRGVARSSGRAPLAIAGAALAILAVAFLNRQPSIDVAPVEASVRPPSSQVAREPSPPIPTTARTSTVSLALPPLNPDARPFVAPASTPQEPGTTLLVPAGSTEVELTVTLPGGWQRSGAGALSKALTKASSPGEPALSISAWRLDDVFVFPCRWSTLEFADQSLMGTAEGQAHALASWWGQDPTRLPNWNSPVAPLATRPRETEIKEYDAWSLEVLVPTGLDLTQCDGGQLVLWRAVNGDVKAAIPGELNRLTVMRVAGEIIVIDAATAGQASPEERRELQEAVDSIEF